MIKLYIGGSPCTHWSIAQTKNRETEPSGLGWELFKNYVIGLHKYKPDYFLYENNKSMSPTIKEQITKELGVEPILINSALVSAQNRNRLYWSNIPGITQPEDKGILLKDILETGIAFKDKAYTLDANYYKATDGTAYSERQSGKRMMDAEQVYPFGTNDQGKGHCLDANYWKGSLPERTLEKHRRSLVAKPIRIGIMPNEDGGLSDSQGSRIYSQEGKSVGLKANGGGGGAKTGLYAIPHEIEYLGSLYDQHSRWGVYGTEGKCPTLTAAMGMGGGHVPMFPELTSEKGNCTKNPTGKKQIYEVRNGLITIKDKQYPIKLHDGYYIIRKLTVKECMRLQTVPEWYIFPVSNSQAYKMLGNGWTVDVIAHQLSFMPGITTEEIEVLSMYDGMSCGHIALDTLGANVIRYYATEIDKYAVQTTKHNFPNTIHLGDAYQVRNPDWKIN